MDKSLPEIIKTHVKRKHNIYFNQLCCLMCRQRSCMTLAIRLVSNRGCSCIGKQSNLQIQCNPYQTTNGIFHRTRTKNFTICMETQKTPNSQSNLEKEKWSWRNQSPGLQTILQSYSNQDSMVLAQKQKYRLMKQDRKPRDKPTHIWSPYP